MNDNGEARRHVAPIEPGGRIIINANETATKVRLLFRDGTEVLATLGPNQTLEMLVGSETPPEIFTDRADTRLGDLRKT